MLVPTPINRVQRVRHELHRRDVAVLRTTQISRNFLAVTFGGESLAGFVSASFDDHVKFMFQDAQGEQVRRDYTPRHFDATRGELTIEFALHGDGPADQWARRARPGDRAVIGGPRGSLVVPTDFDWHLLIGDDAALPAIHRRLEELPAGAQARAIVQIKDADDRRDLSGLATAAEVEWVLSPRALLEAVQRTALSPGEGYVWGGGEAALMAQVRDLVVGDKRHPREAQRISAYWKRGAADFHEQL